MLNRLITTKFPLCVLVTELASQMERRNARVALDRSPRDFNKEADDLSKGVVEAFDPSRRIELSVADFPWIVLRDLVAYGSSFEQENARRRSPLDPMPSKPRKKRPLREIDLW